MSFKANVYKVLIASPSDTVAERLLVPEIIHEWNAAHAASRSVVLLPVKWETHASPALDDRAQGVINRQLVHGCDILIGTFWTRVGTPTGIAESGTVEEIEQFLAAGKRVMLYFSSAPISPDLIDRDQYERLKALKQRCRDIGLVDQYESLDELRAKLSHQLITAVREVHEASVKLEEAERPIDPQGWGTPSPVNKDKLRSACGTLHEDIESILEVVRKSQWATNVTTPGRVAAELLLKEVPDVNAAGVWAAHTRARIEFTFLEDDWILTQPMLINPSMPETMRNLDKARWEDRKARGTQAIQRELAQMEEFTRKLLAR